MAVIYKCTFPVLCSELECVGYGMLIYLQQQNHKKITFVGRRIHQLVWAKHQVTFTLDITNIYNKTKNLITKGLEFPRSHKTFVLITIVYFPESHYFITILWYVWHRCPRLALGHVFVRISIGQFYPFHPGLFLNWYNHTRICKSHRPIMN